MPTTPFIPPPLSLTIDAEWWGRAHLLPREVPEQKGLPKDIEILYQLLDLLDALELEATFFVVAKDFPDHVLRAIDRRGHEIASHSLTHPHFGKIEPASWREELFTSKKQLQEVLGKEVVGFRAPSWSVPFERKDQFLDLLAEAGYQYDSSFCSFENYLYGDRRFARTPYRTEQGLWEIPVPVIGKTKLPWIGGFYLRVLPMPLLKRLLRAWHPAFLYVHPWEFYPQRHPEMNLRDRFITEYGRSKHLKKLERLLRALKTERNFCKMQDLIKVLDSGYPS
jgi:peptidoglycan/xylan/chitin deacetylase (PgdA/CDA1 family)